MRQRLILSLVAALSAIMVSCALLRPETGAEQSSPALMNPSANGSLVPAAEPPTSLSHLSPPVANLGSGLQTAPPSESPDATIVSSQSKGAVKAFSESVAELKEGPGSYRQALELLDQSLAQSPRFAEAYYNKALICQWLGDTRAAEENYLKSIESSPTWTEPRVNLAALYGQTSDLNRALAVIADGIKLDPSNSLLLNNRAMILAMMGRSAEAIGEVRQLLKANANDINAFNSLARIHLNMRDYEMARLICQKAILTVTTAKDNPSIHLNLGLAFLGIEDLRAREELDTALRLDPMLVEALVGRAYLHLKSQEYTQASDMLTRAIAVEPSNTTVRLNLGVALRGQGEYDRAEMQYVEALKSAPGNGALLLNYGILLGDYKYDYLRAADVYRKLQASLPQGAEADKIAKLIKEAENNYVREQRRKEREQKQQEELRKSAESGGSTETLRTPMDTPQTPDATSAPTDPK